jgi:2-enoate reductase
MKLFEPFKIGTMELRNRIVMSPMNVGRMCEADNSWGERIREFYAARARGGTGLITTMWAPVSHTIEPATKGYLNLYSDSHLESLSRVIEGIHQHGAKASVQITAGRGRVIRIRWQDMSIAPVSASATPCYFSPERKARAITTTEAEELAQAFGAAAMRCKTAGADAIEIHGHEGYLSDQFMTGLWNQRTDKYGGSREKRLTFARESIAAIRREVGEDFPIIYRIALDHYLEGGRKPEESLWILQQLEAMGINAFNVDAGCYETMWWPHPPTYHSPGCMVNMAEMAKRAVNVPIIAVGKLCYPDLAEEILQQGKADFIAIGRGLLADPDWANKVREGRQEDIRPCIGDQDGCLGELHEARSTSCTVNPACGHESEWILTPISKKKPVLIVGGGPAGMEAARVAAIKGFDVTLWEKTDSLGGNLKPASAPEFKKDLRLLMDYQITQLKKLPVKIELNKEPLAEEILSFCAQHTILATGAVQEIPKIPRVDRKNVITARDLLLGRCTAEESVLVVGGGLMGCETALHLVQKGHRVTVVELLHDVLLTGAVHHNRLMLLKMLEDCHITVFTNARVTGIADDSVSINQDGRQEVLPIKSVVFAAGMRSCNELQQSLAGQLPGLHAVGDCVQPGHIMNAIWAAYNTARNLQ